MTRDERASIVGLLAPWAIVLPSPDPDAIDPGDRQQVAYSFRGIIAAEPRESHGHVVMTFRVLDCHSRLGVR